MSTQLLLERMRKLREEREHAVAVSTAATGASVTSSVSAVAAASSPQGTGNKIGAATSSSKETGPLGRNSTPTSTMQGLLSIPPAFTSPSGSVLLYRDVHTDPLCIPFTSSAAVDLLERLVGIGRGGEHAGQKHLRHEACLSGRQRAVDYFFPSVRAKQEGALSPTPPLEQNAPNELVSTLYTDAAYKELCADATVDVSGAPRSVCRNVNHFHRRDRIAHGVYGVVFSATEPNGSDRETVFALKHIKKQWLRESQVGFPPYLLREFDLLLRLRHPNIVAAHEVVLLDPHPLPGTRADSAKSVRAGVSPTLPRTTPGVDRLSADEAANSKMKDVFVVMEHYPYDLKEYMFRYSAGVNVPYLHLSSRNHHPDDPQSFLSRVKCIALQLFRGLSFLHDHRILHRDLKTSNILINREGYVKICDFGLGRLYREGQPLTPTVVTLMYRAPELHLGMTDYSHAMDVWSLGCIIAELFLKKPLFRATDDTGHLLAVCDVLGIPTEEAFPGVYKLPLAKDALRAIGRWNRVNKLAQIFQDSHCLDATLLPPSGLDLLQRIFQWCPLNRLTAAEALQHPFFTEAPHPCAPSQLLTPMPSAVTVASGAVQPPIVSRVAEGPTPPPPCVTERKEITDTGALGNGSQPGAATSPMQAPYDLHRGEDREKDEQFQSPTVSISARDEVVRHQRSTEAPSGYGRHSPLSSSEGTASEGEAERVAQQAKLLANQDIEDE